MLKKGFFFISLSEVKFRICGEDQPNASQYFYGILKAIVLNTVKGMKKIIIFYSVEKKSYYICGNNRWYTTWIICWYYCWSIGWIFCGWDRWKFGSWSICWRICRSDTGRRSCGDIRRHHSRLVTWRSTWHCTRRHGDKTFYVWTINSKTKNEKKSKESVAVFSLFLF